MKNEVNRALVAKKKLTILFALLTLSAGLAQAQTNINPHPFTVKIEAGSRHVVYFSTETPTKQTWQESFIENPQILNKIEWEYLLKERQLNGIDAAKFRGWAQLMDENEEHKVTAAYAVLLPDDWAEMYHFYNSAWYKDNEHKEKLFTIGSAFDNNSLKKADMAALQQAGAVFLPCDIEIGDEGFHGRGQYWTSTKEDGFGIYYAYFSTSSTTPSTPTVEINYDGTATESRYVLSLVREVTIIIDENINNVDLLKPWATHQQPVNVKLIRSFTPGMYNTFCLPFDLNAKEVKEVFGETTKLAKFTSGTLSNDKTTLNIDFENINLSDDDDIAIDAGVPYLIQPDDVVTNPTFKQRVIEQTSAAGENFAPNGSIEYLGIINPHHLTGGDNRYLFLQANNRLNWSAAGDTSQMKGMRGYFYVPDMQDMPASCPARLSVRQATQTPTGLGQRTKEQGQRTIKFMHNGKLFIQHNGVIYNMQGGREL